MSGFTREGKSNSLNTKPKLFIITNICLTAKLIHFIFVFSNKACEFKYSHGTKNLQKQNTCQLDDHEGRIYVAGDYEKHECGMKILKSIVNDTGEWRVEVSIESY